MKTFFKARVLFPVLFGWGLGGLLFVLGLGAADDAPGLSFIGLSVAFLLTMRGVYHAGVLPQGYCLPIILLIFGAVGVVMPFILLLDGELDGMLYLFGIGELMGILLLTAGTKRLKKTQRTDKNTSQKNGDKI